MSMTAAPPRPYCFFQSFTPRPPMDAAFEEDYLLYATQGALTLSIGAQSWLLPRSFAAWIPARTRFRAAISKPVTTCSLLSPRGFSAQMPRHHCVFQMSKLTRAMVENCKDWGKKAFHPPEAELFFQATLETCAGLVARSVDVRRPSATDEAVVRAITFTEANLGMELTLGAVAKAAFLSERNMQRRFTEDLGMTWTQLRRRLRMIRAIELLAASDTPVTTIAADCGFASLSAFNRAFLEFAGRSPTQFRKNLSSH